MKHNRIKLIRDFFAPVTMDEMKKLTKDDMAQLGSAIAREMGLTQEQCEFELVAY
jgi:hypothetical protein